MHPPRPVTVQGLIVPADPLRRVEVRELALTAAALSDAIGGGLLDDTLHATYCDTRYTIYLDDDRVARGLPRNDRAAILSAQLGVIDRCWFAALHGDALVLGTDLQQNDADLPRAVLDAARSAGLLSARQPRMPSSPPITGTRRARR